MLFYAEHIFITYNKLSDNKEKKFNKQEVFLDEQEMILDK